MRGSIEFHGSRLAGSYNAIPKAGGSVKGDGIDGTGAINGAQGHGIVGAALQVKHHRSGQSAAIQGRYYRIQRGKIGGPGGTPYRIGSA